jgi:two-component system, OmpR family, response regulator QseB
VEELAARIRSLTRRMRGLVVNRIDVGVLSLDVGTSEVSFRGEPVDLTRREFALLQALMENAGKLVRRESLENSLYGLDHVVGNNALEVLVHSLRRKLSFETIRNVRGFGYMLPQDPK